MTKKKQTFGLIVWLAISFAAAAIGTVASLDAAVFYTQLFRPEWAPPQAVFGPVWSVLYVLMGIAAWQVWRVGGFGASRFALGLFLVQLSLNALWSWLFFAWRLGLWAFVDILLLLALIVATVLTFWRVRRLAGVLLIPYLMWVAFAAVLNYWIWKLNPLMLG